MVNRDLGFELHCLGMGSITFLPYTHAWVSRGCLPRTWVCSEAQAVAELCVRLHVTLLDVEHAMEERNGLRTEKSRS